MNAQEAVRTAKGYILEMFAEEGVTNLGLEEIEFDEQSGAWLVTIGFSRPWNTSDNPFSIVGRDGRKLADRSYKSVRIDDGTRAVLSVRNREVAL